MNYATGYALNVNELMEDFPAKKTKMTAKECEPMIGSRNKDRVASKVFKACIALVLDDIIENSDTFQLPTSSKKCEIYMKRIEDEEGVKKVKKVRNKSVFQDRWIDKINHKKGGRSLWQDQECYYMEH